MPNRAASPNSAPPGRRLTGITAPRLWTPPLRPLNRRTSRGYAVADFAEHIGEPLLPWQRWAVIHAMELLPGGQYRFRTVLILVARQNGKSSLKRTVSLWRLYIDGAKIVLGAAQDVSQARYQWNTCVRTIRDCPDLAAELETVRNVNGDEWFQVTGGGQYRISASNDKAGRGLSIDELNIDELRTQTDWKAWSALSKTTMARPQAQTWAMSNAGSDSSVVLNQLRDAALSGRDPSIGLFEWSGEDGCELDDWEQLRQANPGLGYTIDRRAIESALGTDPPAVFRTEVLCQKVDQLDGAIDLAAWKACADPSGTMDGLRGRLAACFDMAPDGGHCTLAVAALLDDGRPRVEIVRAWKTIGEAEADLPGLRKVIRWQKYGWYPTGPAAALAPLFRSWPESEELTGMRVAEVCQGLAGLARARGLVQPEDPLLDAQIAMAARLPSGDGWRFTRKNGNGEEGHVDAAYAAAGAVNIAQVMPPPKRVSVRMLA